MISGGQGAGNLVRIGHMGPTARSLYPVVGLLAVGRTFADLGVPGEARRRCRGGTGGALGDSARHGMTLPPFELHRPALLEEATELATRHGEDAAFYCGGTELLLLLKLGFAAFEDTVDLKIEVTWRARGERHARGRCGRHAPRARALGGCPRAAAALARMERDVANIRVREVGTLGGNLCFSDPHSGSGDVPARRRRGGVEVPAGWGAGGGSASPIAEFVVGPYQTSLEQSELLTAVRIPALRGCVGRPREVLVPRAASDRDLPGAGLGRRSRREAESPLGRWACGLSGRAQPRMPWPGRPSMSSTRCWRRR